MICPTPPATDYGPGFHDLKHMLTSLARQRTARKVLPIHNQWLRQTLHESLVGGDLKDEKNARTRID
jgi:hypothetical protein